MAERDDLLEKCRVLGIEPEKSRNRVNKETGERYKESTVQDCINAIQKYYIEVYKSQGTLNPFVEDILKLESPMLALQSNKVKPEVLSSVYEDNNNWVFQEKIDGCRCILCYDVNYGFGMFSRNTSVSDCLPTNFSSKFVIPEVNKNLISSYDVKRFIIDTEVVPVYKEVYPMEDGTVVASTQLNLVDSIINSLDDRAKLIQNTNPLKYIAFDILMLNDVWHLESPLKDRTALLDKIITLIKVAGFNDKIEKVPSALVNKEDFYNNIIKVGGEGCVAKDLNSTYTPVKKRNGSWIKLKRTVSQSVSNDESVVGDTVDVFVTGFKEGNVGTANEGLVGALEFSTYLTDDEDNILEDENGNPIIHHIATISGISDELRQALSSKDEQGNVILNPMWYGKVAEIDGQDVSPKNLRFAHAVFKGWRADRSSDTCLFRLSFLKRLVL